MALLRARSGVVARTALSWCSQCRVLECEAMRQHNVLPTVICFEASTFHLSAVCCLCSLSSSSLSSNYFFPLRFSEFVLLNLLKWGDTCVGWFL